MVAAVFVAAVFVVAVMVGGRDIGRGVVAVVLAI